MFSLILGSNVFSINKPIASGRLASLILQYFFETVEDNVLYLKDKKTRKAQKIQRVHSECIKLIWKGDLDNDGKDDFLLDFNGEEYDNFLQLYLTKGSKQIVIPSSKYYLIDCY